MDVAPLTSGLPLRSIDVVHTQWRVHHERGAPTVVVHLVMTLKTDHLAPILAACWNLLPLNQRALAGSDNDIDDPVLLVHGGRHDLIDLWVCRC